LFDWRLHGIHRLDLLTQVRRIVERTFDEEQVLARLGVRPINAHHPNKTNATPQTSAGKRLSRDVPVKKTRLPHMSFLDACGSTDARS